MPIQLKDYHYIADTNAWLQGKFRALVLKTPNLLKSMAVPYYVKAELEHFAEQDKDLSTNAKDALRFITDKYILRILPKPSISHHADREFILYCMANQGEKLAVITNDGNLRKDLESLCPGVMLLRWDNERGKCTMDKVPDSYAGLAQQYRKVLASAAVCGYSEFPLVVAGLLQAGVEKILLSPAVEERSERLAALVPRPGVERMACLGSAGEQAALLARLIVHGGTRRALLLLGEGEDPAPYMDFRNRALRSIDNRGFDVAVMAPDGQVSVLEPQGAPLPPRAAKPAPAQKPALTVPQAMAEAPVAGGAEEVPVHPYAEQIRKTLEVKNWQQVSLHVARALGECLESGKFCSVEYLLDILKQNGLELPYSVLKDYVNKVLLGMQQTDSKRFLTRFTGKIGKKVFKRLIAETAKAEDVKKVLPRLKGWLKKCETEAQKTALNSLITQIEQRR